MGYYVDYSIEPALSSNQHLIHKQLLTMEHINAWVSFPTYFIGIGVNFRQFTVPELSKMFGLPPSPKVTVSSQSFLFLKNPDHVNFDPAYTEFRII